MSGMVILASSACFLYCIERYGEYQQDNSFFLSLEWLN